MSINVTTLGLRSPSVRAESAGVTVLAMLTDVASIELLTKVLRDDRIVIARDPAHGLALAQTELPDVAFIDVTLGDGAGLAMVHHVKALAPDATVFALATPSSLEAGANAVALGGAGLMMLPLGGDEILNAISSVKARRAERSARVHLEQTASLHARAAGWISRVAELAEAPDRTTAAHQLGEILMEATGAAGVAVYLVVGEGSTELARSFVTESLDRAPAFGAQMDVLEFARQNQLLVVPLALRKLVSGHVLLLQPAHVEASPAAGEAAKLVVGSTIDGFLKLLAVQAASALAFLGGRDLSDGGGAIKDPTSSAYSFAYYVDVAGREIDKAKRHGRRFAIATVALDPTAPGSGLPGAIEPPMRAAAEVADDLLKAARDLDVLARVDENEFHLLLPETDGLGAHACRRRVLARLGTGDRRYLPKGLLVGVATFPHDGQNLSQLLRMARRRAEATKGSIVHRLSVDMTGLGDILDALEWDATSAPAPSDVAAARPIELALTEATSLATAVVADALRGGSAFIVVAHHADLSLGSAVRASVGPGNPNVTLHALDVRAPGDGDCIEAMAVIAEHGAYAFIGRSKNGVVRGVHAADPLLADVLAERLGRAAGLRIFT